MAVKLSPVYNEATLDTNGNPWSGAQLFTYVAGSSTKQTTYKDSAAGTPHTNPIVLNARGEPPSPIWITSGVTYKFVLASPTESDPPVSPTRSVDNIAGVNDTTITQDQWVSGATPTYVGATQFTLVGDQTSTYKVGRRIKATVTAGTVYGTILTSAFGAVTTITLNEQSASLDSGLSAISYSLVISTGSDRSVVSGTLATPQATTSGTSFDFTGIPSWARRITVMFVGVSTNGTSNLLIQIGDSGGIETTGYISTSVDAASQVASTAGFIILSNNSANTCHGSMVLNLEDSSDNTWTSFGGVRVSSVAIPISAGSKATSAVLDRVRVTTVNGTDVFDAGEVNISYE